MAPAALKGLTAPPRKRSSRAGSQVFEEHQMAVQTPLLSQTPSSISPPRHLPALSPPPSGLTPSDIVKATNAGLRRPFAQLDTNAPPSSRPMAQNTAPSKVKFEAKPAVSHHQSIVSTPTHKPDDDPFYARGADADCLRHYLPMMDDGLTSEQSASATHAQEGASYVRPEFMPRLPSYRPMVDDLQGSAASKTATSRASDHPPPPPPPARSRSSKQPSPPSSTETSSSSVGAKKHVQAFFKAFTEVFEPRMKGVVDSSMDRQSSALRSTIAKHEEEVRELVRKHDIRMTQIITRHSDDMALALIRAEYQMEQHLSSRTYEQSVMQYEKELADYYRKRSLGRMLFWAAIFGIIAIAIIFNFELMHGHLGGIVGFAISAGYMYLSYRRSLPLRPRRPCPYPGIEGPDAPQGNHSTTPQPPWYMNLQKYNPWHKEPAAWGLFD